MPCHTTSVAIVRPIKSQWLQTAMKFKYFKINANQGNNWKAKHIEFQHE